MSVKKSLKKMGLCVSKVKINGKYKLCVEYNSWEIPGFVDLPDLKYDIYLAKTKRGSRITIAVFDYRGKLDNVFESRDIDYNSIMKVEKI